MTSGSIGEGANISKIKYGWGCSFIAHKESEEALGRGGGVIILTQPVAELHVQRKQINMGESKTLCATV